MRARAIALFLAVARSLAAPPVRCLRDLWVVRFLFSFAVPYGLSFCRCPWESSRHCSMRKERIVLDEGIVSQRSVFVTLKLNNKGGSYFTGTSTLVWIEGCQTIIDGGNLSTSSRSYYALTYLRKHMSLGYLIFRKFYLGFNDISNGDWDSSKRSHSSWMTRRSLSGNHVGSPFREKFVFMGPQTLSIILMPPPPSFGG